jgi:uncharacterized protein with HEPN domain
MRREVHLYIEDIIDCIAKIEEYTDNITDDDFNDSSQIQDAVIRRLEIIGEAVKNIPKSVRDKYPDIPWKNIAGLRDVLIHAYFGVNLKRTWKAVKEDIPDLKAKIMSMRDDLSENNTK